MDFADDLALLSHTRRQMQEKTSTAAHNSAHQGLRVHRGKSKVLKNNTAVSTTPITLEGELEDMTSFIYLGSIVDKQGGLGLGGGGGGTNAHVNVELGKARATNCSKNLSCCMELKHGELWLRHWRARHSSTPALKADLPAGWPDKHNLYRSICYSYG